MPVGMQAFQSSNDVNAMAGGVARDLHTALARVKDFQAFLAITDLTQAPYSMTADDEAAIKYAFTDLNKLAQVYEGTVDSTPAHDYRTYAQHLYGFGRTT